MHGTLAGTITPGQSGPESNSNERISLTTQIWPGEQNTSFGVGVLSLCKRYNQCIARPFRKGTIQT